MVASASARMESPPYAGLSFYTEAEANVFFGRDAERAIIIANLRASRLTLLYAESGVGKSSLLRAGVAARLREIATDRPSGSRPARHIPLVFSSWHDPDPTREVIGAIAEAIAPFTDDGSAPSLPDDLTHAVELATEATGATLVIMLDQFEEHLLYRSGEEDPGRLVRSVAECIARRDVKVHFLIAVREDAYASLGDLFKGRIRNVYGNFLHLGRLGQESARTAIEKPIEHFNATHPEETPWEIEPGLVDAVLAEVRAGENLLVPHEADGNGNGNGGGAPVLSEQIETPYLQLVMTTLWAQARDAGSHQLGLAGLQALGGAREIVRHHLDAALADLSDADRETVSVLFEHLVTPSGAKIVHTVPDLVNYCGRPAGEVQQLIETLAGGDRRILRPVPADAEGNPRVEIFHDVLAPAIVAWRAQQKSLRLAREKRAAERRARRNLILAIGAACLFVVAVGGVVLAEVQRAHARHAEHQSASAALAGAGFHNLTNGALGPGVLLGIAAYRASPTQAARDDLTESQVNTQGLVHYLSAQSAPVNRVVFDPAGTDVASGSVDGTVVLWDMRTGRRRTLLAGPEPVDSVAFSRDGRYLAASDAGGAVHIWTVATGRVLHTLSTGTQPAYDVAFAPSGGSLAAASADGSITFWSMPAGRPLRRLRQPGGAVTAIAFSPQGGTIAAGDSDGTVVLWNLSTGRRRETVPVGQGVNGVAFSPTGALVAAAGQNGAAILIAPGSGRTVAQLSEPSPAGTPEPVESVAFSPDGRQLASAGAATDVWLWDARSRHLLRTFQGQLGTVESVAFNPTGTLIASGSDDHSVFVWSTALAGGRRALESTHGQIYGLASDPAMNLAATVNGDGTVSVWNLATGAQQTLHPHDGTINAVAFTPAGGTLAAVGSGGAVVLWSVPGFTPMGRLSRPGSGTLWSVTFSADGALVASGADSGDALVWDASSHRLLHDLAGHAGLVTSVAFDPSGARLASGDGDGTVILWRLQDGRREFTLTGHTAAVDAVTFSPNGRLLASAGDDDRIILWRADSGTASGQPLGGAQGPVDTIAFSPDGRSLVSGAADHTVVVWDLSTRLGDVLDGHVNDVTGVAYSPHGATIVTADQSGRIVLYAAPAASATSATAIEQRLCAVIGANLTAAQWSEFAPQQPYDRPCPTDG